MVGLFELHREGRYILDRLYIPRFNKDTEKNSIIHLAAIQVLVWDNIYNIDAVRRRYSITATKSNKFLTMFT